jgi:hypothetical protein
VLQGDYIQSFPGVDVVGTVTTGGEILGQYGYAITLTSGQVDANNNFGNYLNGSIHGFKFEDMDANGLFDGTDVAMVGVWIELSGDVDGDGDIDTGQVQTDANGKFSFLNLHPGTYTVTELFTDGGITWGATVDHDDADLIGDNHTTVTVQSGEELVAFEGDANLGAEDPQHEVIVGYNLMFGNHAVAVGLTPGFWANHLYVWDGIDNNGPQDGQGRYLADKLADSGVIEEPDIRHLLPGGGPNLVFETDDGRSLTIQWEDAQQIVNQSNKKGGDKLYDFVRYAITTLLNDVGVPGFSAGPVLSDIADWLIQYGPTSHVGLDYLLTYNNGFPANSKIRANDTAWQMGDIDTPAGSDIFAAMTALTDDAGSNTMVVSLNGSYVFSSVNYGNYFGIRTWTRNVVDDYLLLV